MPPPPPPKGQKRATPQGSKARATHAPAEAWTEVVGRRAKREAGPATTPAQRPPSKKDGGTSKIPKKGPSKRGEARGPAQTPPKAGKKKEKRRKPPSTAAITITCPEGKYTEVLKLAKSKIDLASLGISELRSRRGLTGSIVYEVGGEDNTVKANALAKEIRKALVGHDNV
ncbi:hypothetical protein PUN28_015287 [Cardiocondyla obscurior]|uniref:Uncharacterized protein n=1 Tax=Cardiocondyla obscurior TaxID=286306 RepID=A0AAW2F2K2_9HYME